MLKPEIMCTLHSSEQCKDREYDKKCSLNKHATCVKRIVIEPPTEANNDEDEEKPYQPTAPVILDDSDRGPF